jgi:hypothetical protein
VAAKIEIISLPLSFVDMKSFFSLISGLAAVVFGVVGGVGCAPAETFLRSDVPGGVLEITATDIGAHGITIEASSSWMFDNTIGAPHGDEARWLTARYDTNNPALMWVETLSRNENIEHRLDTVVVVSGDGLRLEILVRQGAMDVSFDVTPASLEPFGARETDTRTVTVSSTIAWEYDLIDQSDWLTVTRGADAADGTSGTLTVAAAPTRSLDLRRDTIVVRPVNDNFHGTHTSKVPVEQAGIDLVVESEAMNPAFAIEIPAGGGEIPLSIYSRAAWTASMDVPAERASLNMTSGPADIESGIPVVMTAAANPSTEQFEFTLTLTSAGQKYEYVCTQQGNQAESGTE